MKENKESSKSGKKLLEIKLCLRKLIKGINIKAFFLVRQSGPFLDWITEELRNTNLRTLAELVIVKKVRFMRETESQDRNTNKSIRTNCVKAKIEHT